MNLSLALIMPSFFYLRKMFLPSIVFLMRSNYVYILMFSFETVVIRSSVDILVVLYRCFPIDFLFLVEDDKLLFSEWSAWAGQSVFAGNLIITREEFYVLFPQSELLVVTALLWFRTCILRCSSLACLFSSLFLQSRTLKTRSNCSKFEADR